MCTGRGFFTRFIRGFFFKFKSRKVCSEIRSPTRITRISALKKYASKIDTVYSYTNISVLITLTINSIKSYDNIIFGW